MKIQEKLKDHILTELLSGGSTTDLDPEEDLIDTGILDSVSLMELISFLEEDFEISIAPSEILPDYFRTLNALTHFIEGKTADPSSDIPG